MAQTTPTVRPQGSSESFSISPQQVEFFKSFGFLKFPGLFENEIGTITEGFEEVFEDESIDRVVSHEPLHLEHRRTIIPHVIDKSPKLSWIRDDPRTVAIISTLIGKEYEYSESDGNLFDCESSWHPDTYGSPLTQLHVKMSFYLDPLHGETGAIRVIPGTNWHDESFAKRLRDHFDDPEEISNIYGVDVRDIPSYPIESDPGDLIVWNFRTIHASFYGGQRRRLFSVNWREKLSEEELAKDQKRRAAVRAKLIAQSEAKKAARASKNA